jgi:predicted RNase H-like HicB family nuclease
MKYVYPACFYRENDGRYTAEFADFPLATYGDDLADAMNMAVNAAAGRILLMLKDGEPLPRASDPKEIVPEDASGFVSMVCIDLAGGRFEDGGAEISKTVTIPARGYENGVLCARYCGHTNNRNDYLVTEIDDTANDYILHCIA